jgi:hypothetical protein
VTLWDLRQRNHPVRDRSAERGAHRRSRNLALARLARAAGPYAGKPVVRALYGSAFLWIVAAWTLGFFARPRWLR